MAPFTLQTNAGQQSPLKVLLFVFYDAELFKALVQDAAHPPVLFDGCLK